MVNDQKSTLLDLIKSHPNGIKEYDLLKLLQNKSSEDTGNIVFDHLALFQQHFILFHALYKLNDQLHMAKAGQLIIEALNIQWVPHCEGQGHQVSVNKRNSLREYYLNIKNLEETSYDDVINLLTNFWVGMNNNNDKISALAILELDEFCDFITIKKRYRQLLSRYHPDKGGSVVLTQSLNEAMVILKRCYTNHSK